MDKNKIVESLKKLLGQAEEIATNDNPTVENLEAGNRILDHAMNLLRKAAANDPDVSCRLHQLELMTDVKEAIEKFRSKCTNQKSEYVLGKAIPVLVESIVLPLCGTAGMNLPDFLKNFDGMRLKILKAVQEVADETGIKVIIELRQAGQPSEEIQHNVPSELQEWLNKHDQDPSHN